jgi:hypothetical protein
MKLIPYIIMGAMVIILSLPNEKQTTIEATERTDIVKADKQAEELEKPVKSPVKRPEMANIVHKPTKYELIAKYFPSHVVEDAKKIMYCESGGREDARNYNPPIEDSHGLFQINNYLMPSRGTRDQLVDAEFNIKKASEIYNSKGRFGVDWVICSRNNGVY